MNIKKFLLLTFITFQCTLAHGQKKWMTDTEFNHPKVACYINDTFVKNFIGFDMKAFSKKNTNIIKEDLTIPLIINGIEYKGKVTIKCNDKIELITLDDVRKLYYPEVITPIVYMINEYFITNDTESYKLDKSHINKCEIILSSDFEIFKEAEPFSIIRIFTKNNDKSVRLR